MSKHFEQAKMLMERFDKTYKERHDKPYKGNRAADKWGFVDMIDDLGASRAAQVIDYYFKTKPRKGHDRQHLIYHYHEYDKMMTELEAERDKKRQLLQKMREEYE